MCGCFVPMQRRVATRFDRCSQPKGSDRVPVGSKCRSASSLYQYGRASSEAGVKALCDSRVVVTRFSARFRDWEGALEDVAHSGPLRRAQISFAAMWAGESAFMVALAVVAFRSGGVAAVGAVTA